jgi:hypothetical protein
MISCSHWGMFTESDEPRLSDKYLQMFVYSYSVNGLEYYDSEYLHSGQTHHINV